MQTLHHPDISGSPIYLVYLGWQVKRIVLLSLCWAKNVVFSDWRAWYILGTRPKRTRLGHVGAILSLCICSVYVECSPGYPYRSPDEHRFWAHVGAMLGPILYWLFIWAPMPEPRWKCLFEAYLGDMLGPCWAYVGLYWMMQDDAAWCNFVQLKPCRTARKKVLHSWGLALKNQISNFDSPCGCCCMA